MANKKDIKRDYIYATGRRKEAVARVRLYASVKDDMSWGETAIKKGDMVVNAKPIAQYFPSETQRLLYTEPFRVANAQNKYTMTVRVVGGGPKGQLDATIAGIANALVAADEAGFRPALKAQGFLTRDARVRQRRMVGTGGKARRQKQSPKR
jgi:small subunit ribosomal protein S9